MPNLTNPVNLPFENWSNHIRNDLTTMRIPISNGEKDWRQWARHVILLNPQIVGIPIPSEIQYPEDKDWRQWATYFYQIIQALP
jgi:hypothetical protein